MVLVQRRRVGARVSALVAGCLLAFGVVLGFALFVIGTTPYDPTVYCIAGFLAVGMIASFSVGRE